ncbi:hypothetical protein M885DRAFT_586900 [Pelagophyceae sp. CCMP2097]|nr:hypothetical protein M885DRAFT_586900 [Pelagophyceae sp. CCMP2097]
MSGAEEEGEVVEDPAPSPAPWSPRGPAPPRPEKTTKVLQAELPTKRKAKDSKRPAPWAARPDAPDEPADPRPKKPRAAAKSAEPKASPKEPKAAPKKEAPPARKSSVSKSAGKPARKASGKEKSGHGGFAPVVLRPLPAPVPVHVEQGRVEFVVDHRAPQRAPDTGFAPPQMQTQHSGFGAPPQMQMPQPFVPQQNSYGGPHSAGSQPLSFSTPQMTMQMQPQMQQMQPQVQQTQNRFQTAPRHAPPFEQNGFDAAPQKYAQRPLAVEQQSGFAPQSGFDSGFDAAPQPRAMGFDDAPVNGFGAASADADVSEVSEEASGDVVLLDLDNTLVHMLPRAVMPKCAAISEAVVDVTVADGSTHSIAVRRGAGRFLRALAKRKDAVVQIVTMNKYGVECCAAIAQSDAPDAEAWAAVSVVLVAGRVPGSKSLPFVAKGAKHVLILDDSASAWDDEARPFVRLALKYDVMKQLKTSDDIEEEVGYLDKVRRDALVFLDAAAPAAVAVVEQEVPAAFSQEPQAFAQEPLDEHSMNELLGTPMNEANSNEPVVQEAVQEEEGSSSPDRALTCVRCAFVGPSEGDAAAHVAQCAAAATCDVCEGPHLSKFHEADSSFHDADSSGFSAGEASSGFSAGFGSAAAPSESSESAAAAPAGFDAEAGGEEPVAGEFYEDREGSWSHADDGPNEATSAEAKNAEAHADKKVRNAATRDAAVRERADKEDAKRKTSERKSSSFSPPLRGPDVALKATRKPPVKGLAGDAMAAAAFAKGKLAPPRKPRGAANTEGVKEPVAKGKDYTTKAPFNDKPMFKAPFNTEHRPRGAPPQRELQAVHRPTPREPRPRPPNERPAPRPEKRRSPSPSPPRYAVRADDDAAARAYRGGYDARPPRAQEPRRSQRDGDHFAQLQGAFGNRNSPEFVYHRGGAAAADREPPAQYYAPRDDGYSQRPQYAPQYAQPPMQYMQQAPRGMMPYDGRPSMPYDPRLAQQQPFQQQDYPPQRMRYL